MAVRYARSECLARLRGEIAAGRKLSLEDLHTHCVNALRTETQVMVKREDEQAFAELNGAYIKFVEDAVRLIYAQLAGDKLTWQCVSDDIEQSYLPRQCRNAENLRRARAGARWHRRRRPG